MFDWIEFFNARGIQYRTSGPNVARGNVTIKCPFCKDDPSEHLSVNLEGKGWHCWRQQDHVGRSPVALIMALIGCSVTEAEHIAGVGRHLPTDFMATVSNMITPDKRERKLRKLALQRNMKPFTGLPSERPYRRYLRERGFSTEHANDHGLHYCTFGPFKSRIIFPVMYEGNLVTWTGRAVWEDQEPRYKTLSTNEETALAKDLPVAAGKITDYLLWYDSLFESDADTIVLCEGPFDAFKVRVLGRHVGITATCFFTTQPSEQQINHLHEVLPRFKKRYLLQDQGALDKAMQTTSRLTTLNVRMKQLPAQLKDPGEIPNRDQLLKILLDDK